MYERRDVTTGVCYRPGADGPFGRRAAFLVRALPVVVPRLGAVRAVCRSSALALLAGRWHGRYPGRGAVSRGRERFELASSGWSRVLGVDAVGGPPHGDFADEGGARVASRCSPDWLVVTSGRRGLGPGWRGRRPVGIALPGSPPDGMVMERCWNAGEPGQRSWAGRRELWEAPVEDGGHVACGSEFASGGGCQQVAEWVLTGFGRQGEQVGSQGRPGRLGGESGDVLVGLVELCNDLGSDELFGCDVEAVGVALDGLEQPGRRVVEFAQQGGGGDGRFIAGEDLLQRLGRRARCDGVGSDEGVGVAVADDLEVEVVGVPAAGEHGVQLLAGFLPGQQAVHGVGGDALGAVDGGGVAETGRGADVVSGAAGR